MQVHTIRILIIDDHSIVRQGIRSLLSNHADMQVVGEADNAAVALELAHTLQPDVALLDIRMPGCNGLELVQPLLQVARASKILVLTSFDDEDYVAGAMRLGVHGFINKGASDEMLVGAIRGAQGGDRVFSPSVMNHIARQFATLSRIQAQHQLGLADEEMQLLRLLVDGASNAEMAGALFVSEATVKRKLQDVFKKLNVTTRAQAAAMAVRQNLV